MLYHSINNILRLLVTLFRTLFSRLLLILLIIVWSVPVIIYMLLPQSIRYRSSFFFWLAKLFYSATLRIALIPVKYEGLEHVPVEPAIIIGNHQSSFDIPLLGKVVDGHPHIWLALATLKKSLLLRFILPRVAVLVDTSTAMKGMRTLLEVMNIAKMYQTHIMIFPEGGRFTDGIVHNFFGGFVLLAKHMNRPVLPVYIHGINRVYPPNSFLVYLHPVTVTVGPLFVMDKNETDEMFKKRVYDWFIAQANREY